MKPKDRLPQPLMPTRTREASGLKVPTRPPGVCDRKGVALLETRLEPGCSPGLLKDDSNTSSATSRGESRGDAGAEREDVIIRRFDACSDAPFPGVETSIAPGSPRRRIKHLINPHQSVQASSAMALNVLFGFSPMVSMASCPQKQRSGTENTTLKLLSA